MEALMTGFMVLGFVAASVIALTLFLIARGVVK